MSKLSSKIRDSLKKNPNILKITDSNISYTSKFKEKAIKLLDKGLSADIIFLQAGIDTSSFAKDYALKSIIRWKKTLTKYGSLKTERRGLKAKGRPKNIKFQSLREEVAYLRAEVDFLKKLQALEDDE